MSPLITRVSVFGEGGVLLMSMSAPGLPVPRQGERIRIGQVTYVVTTVTWLPIHGDALPDLRFEVEAVKCS